jgi:hypothetical protein
MSRQDPDPYYVNSGHPDPLFRFFGLRIRIRRNIHRYTTLFFFVSSLHFSYRYLFVIIAHIIFCRYYFLCCLVIHNFFIALFTLCLFSVFYCSHWLVYEVVKPLPQPQELVQFRKAVENSNLDFIRDEERPEFTYWYLAVVRKKSIFW